MARRATLSLWMECSRQSLRRQLLAFTLSKEFSQKSARKSLSSRCRRATSRMRLYVLRASIVTRRRRKPPKHDGRRS